MKRIFIIPVVLIALLALFEVYQPEVEMKEIKLVSLPKNPQCTFHRTGSDPDSASSLLTAYHHGPERVFLGVINPHITGFSGFSESVTDGKHVWTAGHGKNLTLRANSKSWTSRFFGYSLKLELSEKSKADQHVDYSGTMRVKHRFRSEKIDVTGRCIA